MAEWIAVDERLLRTREREVIWKTIQKWPGKLTSVLIIIPVRLQHLS
jgi:hypothetical protein